MPKVLFDFTDPAAVAGWRAIDDRVMGGRSQSRLRHDPGGHAVFEGEVSLAQGGGFASVRSSPGGTGWALGHPGAQVCVLELRGGQGRLFKLSLFTDDGFDSVSWQAPFSAPAAATPDGAPAGWTLQRLPLDAFRASFRGREVPEAPALDPARIRQVGLLIGSRQAGSFALALRRLWLE